jgi:hypothetical protein
MRDSQDRGQRSPQRPETDRDFNLPYDPPVRVPGTLDRNLPYDPPQRPEPPDWKRK